MHSILRRGRGAPFTCKQTAELPSFDTVAGKRGRAREQEASRRGRLRRRAGSRAARK